MNVQMEVRLSFFLGRGETSRSLETRIISHCSQLPTGQNCKIASLEPEAANPEGCSLN